MNSIVKQWPDDADGDVLRRMKARDFDFEQPCLIDFNVDFEVWPPSETAMRMLEQQYPSTKAYPSGTGGYVQFQIYGKLTYDLVICTQRDVSQEMAEFGGVCESWGVLH
ncbi:MAG: ribonuclease E inhibitor RraB [Paucibacter sp.]|nr:ribonuclease E inhibitor RraB [Roseateles sp.]